MHLCSPLTGCALISASIIKPETAVTMDSAVVRENSINSEDTFVTPGALKMKTTFLNTS